jgi:hypothetical protein
MRTINGVTSDNITVIQIVKGSDGGAKMLAGLTEAQKSGRACIVCAGTGDVTEHIGYVDGTSVKVHMRCAAQWRYGPL